ncbi:HHAT [Cordylochernes scorpioides]|uniref:HHAT n=1 Tax=Cordylochernes scorpioides TaxID=51811 RepID=A0ABY6LTT6_9ARAC|nr:HHAT [Cordylochernes scorpioides]
MSGINHWSFNQRCWQVREQRRSKAWCRKAVVEGLRCAGSCVLLELSLHWLYPSAMQFYPQLVWELSGWELAGLGYCLTLLFYLKYLALYRLAGWVAGLEGLVLPHPPCCVSRIHLCSLLWRYFYHPLAGSKNSSNLRKAAASSVCFGFVLVWHGWDKAVVVWCALNFVGVSLERWLLAPHTNWSVRLQALVSSPFFLLMCLSSIFFLSNYDVGMVFIQRIILSGFPIPLLPLLAIMYCGAQVSLHVQRLELKRRFSSFP